MARFSVIVPAYNVAEWIEAALRSVLRQTRQDFEVIVVDDGSSDGTGRVVAAMDDSRITLLEQENCGQAAARNLAIKASGGEFIALLDSDDLWLPRYLEVMGGALHAHPEAGLAYTDGWVLHEPPRRLRKGTAMEGRNPPMPPPAAPEDFLRELVQRNFVYPLATVRRSVLDDVGVFDPELPPAEDYELWLRIVARGYGAVRPPGLLAVSRRRPGSESTDALRMARSEERIYRKVVREYDVSPEIRRLAQRRADETRALAAAYASGEMRTIKRRVLVRLKNLAQSIRRRGQWYRTPPKELVDVFPDLFRPSSSAGGSA
jgi:glycosyltransferase involved in cell wall biosynthesis